MFFFRDNNNLCADSDSNHEEPTEEHDLIFEFARSGLSAIPKVKLTAVKHINITVKFW